MLNLILCNEGKSWLKLATWDLEYIGQLKFSEI